MTNIEALRSILLKMEHEPTDEAIEFLDAIEEEFNGGDNEDISEKNEEIEELQQEISSLKEDWVDPDRLISIDCGIGIIQYIEPDNLKLRLTMQDFKEKKEKIAYQ